MSNPNKAVLAFSGGLDTSFAVPYLMERGVRERGSYEIITATVNTGGFSEQELGEIAKRSEQLGASKHVEVDGKASMYDNVASYIIKANALYEGAYPNMCSDRYTIAEEVAKVALDEEAGAVVHGSSAMGNDQVRFDMALKSLVPDLKIITPTRDTGGNREFQQKFLADRGIETPARSRDYSVNQNILGLTYSGDKIDTLQEADQSMFEWTQPTRSDSELVTVKFRDGLPVAIDGSGLHGEEIIAELNQRAGAFGFGRGYYTGDCVIGIKGRIAFEAPGVLSIIEAHKALEQVVHTKSQHDIGKLVCNQFSDLLFSGKYYDPAVDDLKAYLDSQQSRVNGTVTLRLAPNRAMAVAIDSDDSLINPDVATYAQHSTWSSQDAKGFIELYGKQQSIAALREQR